MKNFIALAALIAILFHSCKSSQKNSHSSQASVDWKGVYSGIIPCADCEGKIMRITLREDQTFLMQTKYLGKDTDEFLSAGNFEWSKDGSQIFLKDQKVGSVPTYYKVGENKLIQLDINGKPITGNMAGMYELVKDGPANLNRYSYYLKGDTLQLIRARMAPLAIFHAVYLK